GLGDVYKRQVVKAGSQCSKTMSKSISDGWVHIRQKLIDSNVLEEKDNIYVFREDAIFSSISAAASVILGRQAAGPLEWIDNNGITYKDNQKNKFGLN
ncbi:MAG: DUF4357 domain-containing protein, partial [Syntrophales bacterium]|nr:DUF4357 domain-containing protein [Syntrophales bacterium]